MRKIKQFVTKTFSKTLAHHDKAIIVDDEPYCCESLETLLERYYPGVAVSASNVNWFRATPESFGLYGFRAVFTDGVIKTMVLYDNKGNLNSIMRYYTEDQLPQDIRHRAKPKVITACTNFSQPKTVPAISSKFLAGIPEAMRAANASTKDPTPKSFSIFGKLQGLKSINIACTVHKNVGIFGLAHLEATSGTMVKVLPISLERKI